MKSVAKMLVFILILAVAVLASLGTVHAETIYLTNITDGTTLSEAGTTYILDGQTYNLKGQYGAIKITQNNITLDCNSSTLIGDGTGMGVRISDLARGIKITGCTFENYDRAITTNDAADPLIIGNVFKENKYGIYFAGLLKNSDVKVSMNIGKNNKESFVYILGRGLQDTVTILGNDVYGGRNIIDISSVENLKIGLNKLSNAESKGIRALIIKKLEIADNTVNSCTSYGIYVSNVEELTAKGNSGNSDGNFIYAGGVQTKAEVKDNSASYLSFAFDSYCINLLGSGAQQSVVSGNKCSRVNYGIRLSDNFKDTEIYENEISGQWNAGMGISVEGETNSTKVYSNEINDFAVGISISPQSATEEPLATLVYDNLIKDGKTRGIQIRSIVQAGTEIYGNTIGGFKKEAILLENSKNLQVYNNTDYYTPLIEKMPTGISGPVEASSQTPEEVIRAASEPIEKEYIQGFAPRERIYTSDAQPATDPANPRPTVKTFLPETGIKLVNSESNKIEGNKFNYYTYGLYLLNSKKNEILTNTFNYNEYGMFLEKSDENTIKTNEAKFNKEAGLKLKDSKTNTVESNKLTNNKKYGLALDDATGNSFTSNNFKDNKEAAAYLVAGTKKLTSDSDDTTNTWTTNEWPETTIQTAMVPAKPGTNTIERQITSTVTVTATATAKKLVKQTATAEKPAATVRKITSKTTTVKQVSREQQPVRKLSSQPAKTTTASKQTARTVRRV